MCINLNMPSWHVLCIHCLLVCFPCRYLTLAPETVEESFVEISDTEPEIQWVLLRRPIQARGRSIPLPCSFSLTLLSFSLERCCLILSILLCHVSNPYSQCPHNPANHCIAKLPLLSH